MATGGSTGVVEALNLGTGTRRWSVTLPGSVLEPITAADNIFYVVAGHLRAFDDQTGKLLWVNGPDYMSSATVVGDRLYIGGETALWALRAGRP